MGRDGHALMLSDSAFALFHVAVRLWATTRRDPVSDADMIKDSRCYVAEAAQTTATVDQLMILFNVF